MANDRVEQRLQELKILQAAGQSLAGLNDLRVALSDRVNVIAAKAAAIADEWQARVLVPDLLKAFERLFLKPAENDAQCWGKNAISKALKNFGFGESPVFLKGLRHRQWEATWGGKTDTAAILRGTCALALVQCVDITRDDTLRHLVEAVTEADARVRSDAARALEQMGGREAVLLLRLKARTGDQEPGVTGQVLESLLHLEGAASVSFVDEFLKIGNDEVMEEAALALGASRLAEAVDVLRLEYLKLNGRGNGSVLLRALSASRQDAAITFLLDQIRNAPLRWAEEALRAFELHRDSDEIVNRVREAASEREELRELLNERF